MCIEIFKNDEIKNTNTKLMMESCHCPSAFITINQQLSIITKKNVLYKLLFQHQSFLVKDK